MVVEIKPIDVQWWEDFSIDFPTTVRMNLDNRVSNRQIHFMYDHIKD